MIDFWYNSGWNARRICRTATREKAKVTEKTKSFICEEFDFVLKYSKLFDVVYCIERVAVCLYVFFGL